MKKRIVEMMMDLSFDLLGNSLREAQKGETLEPVMVVRDSKTVVVLGREASLDEFETGYCLICEAQSYEERSESRFPGQQIKMCIPDGDDRANIHCRRNLNWEWKKRR